MTDELSERHGELLAGAYDCVDRIVLNAYFSLGHNPGGFRVWWRRLHDNSEEQLDNAHLMRMAGRFSRRVRAFAKANGIPVIDCGRGERKHRIAEEYLATHTVGVGVFLILVARAAATVWEVKRSTSGVIGNLAKKTAYVSHYSFHIMDPEWGHLTVKMSGHPPFGAQVIAGGHEWVALKAQAAGIGFTKEGNCFTAVADPQALAQVADTLSQPAAVGRLRQVCERWIYSACLCFGLDADAQARSGFRYAYSVYQAEYSRNLLFRSGGQMDRVFNTVADRTRGRLDVPMLRTLFGAKQRPRLGGTRDLSPRLAAMIETPRWDLTLFKVHFGRLTLKGYTKGEHVLRLEAVVHNTRQLGCGRALGKFPEIVTRLQGMTERFCTTLDCVDTGFLPDGTLDALPLPARIGATPGRRHRSEQATDPGRAGGGPGAFGRTRRLHRRRPGRQGAGDGRPDRLHHPPGRLRPAQAPRQGPDRQTRPVTALPGPPTRRPHHRRPARPARPGHRPHPGRYPQPPTRPQTRPLDRHRPRLRDPPHRHADPLRRPRHHHQQCRGIDNLLSIRHPQAPSPAQLGSGEICFLQRSSAEAGPPRLNPGEVRSLQPGRAQVCVPQVGPREVCFL
jgi:hypothetical protein